MSTLFYCKDSSDLLRKDSQTSYSFGKIQNVRETELSEEKNLVFIGESFRISFSYIFFRYFCLLFPSFRYIISN